MSNTDDRADSLDRARMHERLADVTEDTAARAMHRAMAAEYRRRAGDQGGMAVPLHEVASPRLEVHAEML